MKKKHYTLTIIFLLKSGIIFSQINSYYYEWNKNIKAIKSQNIIERTIIEYENGDSKGTETNRIYYDSIGQIILEIDCYSPSFIECDTLKYFYDKSGNQTKCIWYWKDIKETEVTIYRYKNNHLTEYEEYTINRNKEISDTNNFRLFYDDENRLKFEIDNMNDTITICNYQDDNRVKMVRPKTGNQSVYKNNRLVFSNYSKDNYSYEYDEKGNLTLSKRMNKKGELISQTEFIYINGLITQSKSTNNERKIERREEYFYKKK